LGLSMLTLAVGAYAAGLLVDHGIAARSVAIGIGLVMLIPAALWRRAMQLWRVTP